MQELLQIFISTPHIAIGVSVIIGFTGLVLTVNSNINKRLGKKADKEATEREFDLMHEKINEKADRSVVIKMSKQLDTIYDHLINKK